MREVPAARAVLLAMALALAGCRDRAPAPLPSEAAASPVFASEGLPVAPASAPTSAESAPGASASASVALDASALHERRDPARLLRYYVAALEQGRWGAAAHAWRSNSGVTAATLRASYDRGRSLSVEVGKGDEEGAAGSIYYEVPVTLRFAGGAPQRGTLTLRRVNDVPGATPEQLDWRIERSTIGAGQ